MKKNVLRSLLLKSLVVIAVLYGMVNVTEGLRTLTKFTTLSNLGIALASLLFIPVDLQEWKTGRNTRTRGLYNFKFLMTTAILLTFFVYMFILAPTNSRGFIGAYLQEHCGSFALHFVSPVFAFLDFCLNDRDYVPNAKNAACSVIFPLGYVAYIVLLASVGFRWSHGMSAPYNFLNFGAPVGWWGIDLSTFGKTSLGIGVGYMIIVLAILFLLMSALMIRLRRKLTEK